MAPGFWDGFWESTFRFVVLWFLLQIPCGVIAVVITGQGPSDGWKPGWLVRLYLVAFGVAVWISYATSSS